MEEYETDAEGWVLPGDNVYALREQIGYLKAENDQLKQEVKHLLEVRDQLHALCDLQGKNLYKVTAERDKLLYNPVQFIRQ